jgi:hypothetical protein
LFLWKALYMKQCIHQAISSHQSCGNFFLLKKNQSSKKLWPLGAFSLLLHTHNFFYICSNKLLWDVLGIASISCKGKKPQPRLPSITFSHRGAISTLRYMVEWVPYAKKPQPLDTLFHHIMNINWCLYGWYQLSMHIIIRVLCKINSNDDDFIKANLGEMGYSRRSYKMTIPNYKFIKGQFQIGSFNK